MTADSGAFVTDTHAFAYYAAGKFSKLSRRARLLFDAAEDRDVLICIPTIVLAELTILIDLDRVHLPTSFDRWCRQLEANAGFSIEPLSWTDVNEMRLLPFKDPFDRLIAGTAKRLGLPLITKDVEIADSGLIDTVW